MSDTRDAATAGLYRCVFGTGSDEVAVDALTAHAVETTLDTLLGMAKAQRTDAVGTEAVVLDVLVRLLEGRKA